MCVCVLECVIEIERRPREEQEQDRDGEEKSKEIGKKKNKTYSPVQAFEEHMRLDLINTTVTKATKRISDQQSSDDAGGRGADVLGDFHLRVQDLLVHLLHVLVVERGKANKHFKDKGTDGPPVYFNAIAVRMR